MNYEQKHKDALINSNSARAKHCELIFPELKESEDEMIRKAILEHIQLCSESIPDRDRWIAWLEKQGEQKQDPCKHCKDKCLNCYNFPCIDKRTFEQQQEQTIEIPFGAKDSKLQEVTYHIPDGYHAEIKGNEVVIKKSEQKTTWKPTEEQIEALEHLLETIRRHEYSYFHEEKFLLLHSLLEQLKEL